MTPGCLTSVRVWACRRWPAWKPLKFQLPLSSPRIWRSPESQLLGLGLDPDPRHLGCTALKGPLSCAQTVLCRAPWALANISLTPNTVPAGFAGGETEARGGTVSCDGRADAHELPLSPGQVPTSPACLPVPRSPSTFRWLPPQVGFCHREEPPACKRWPFVSLAGVSGGQGGAGPTGSLPGLSQPGGVLCLQVKSRWT